MAKALAYRDTSIRIAVASQPRALFLGFINNTDEVGPPIAGVTRAIANTLVTITRIGSDDAPVFVPGPAIAIVTSTREPIHGTSVIIDPDTAALSSLTLLDSGGQPAAGQPPVAQTLVIDTPSGYSLTVPWTIPATATPQVPRSFTLTVVMGGRTLSQLISVVPLTVPDRSFAIISDAPLALVITALGSAPLRRQIRLERNGAVVDAVAGGATFYLIGDVPTGLSLDATSASLVYDLAIMPVGIHRYSLLAAMTVNGQVLSVEQPTVLRVLASPISAAN